MTQLYVGADPELFLLNGEGQNVSGHGVVPGSKKSPHKVPKGAVQVDGTALEFNIDPAKNKKEFIGNIETVMSELRKMLPEDHRFDMSAAVEYEQAYFDSLPKYAKRLGCMPDYDAYTGYQMLRPDADQTLRTAAGHIHVGWTKDMRPFSGQHFQSCRTFVKEMDASVGLQSVLYDQEGQKRRALYGQAGAFRPKPYGVEYRVLSNAWLKSPEMIEWMYEQVVNCYNRLCAKQSWFHQMIPSDAIEEIINSGDVEKAETFLANTGQFFPPGYKIKYLKPQPKTKPKKTSAKTNPIYHTAYGQVPQWAEEVPSITDQQWQAALESLGNVHTQPAGFQNPLDPAFQPPPLPTPDEGE